MNPQNTNRIDKIITKVQIFDKIPFDQFIKQRTSQPQKSSKRMRSSEVSSSDRSEHKQKSLVEIFRQLSNNEKDQLTKLLYDEQEFKSMPEIFVERKYKSKWTRKHYVDEILTRDMNSIRNLESTQYDDNQIRDLYQILYLTINQNSTKINTQKPLFDSPDQKVRIKNITLKQISNLPYQFLFGDLIEFANFNNLIITKIDFEFRISIAHQLFNHCQQLRYREINLKFPQFKDFFKNIGNISFPNLQELYLAKCEIQSIEGLGYVDMPVLRVLDLESNMISCINSLAKFIVSHKIVQSIYLGDNLIFDFTKLSRLNIRKVVTFRLSPAGLLFGPTIQKALQGEDLSFLLKNQFQLVTIRAVHAERIRQQRVIDCLSRIDNKVYIYKS